MISTPNASQPPFQWKIVPAYCRARPRDSAERAACSTWWFFCTSGTATLPRKSAASIPPPAASSGTSLACLETTRSAPLSASLT